MKYLKKFDNHAAYAAAESGLILPNVSLCVQENEVHYKPSTPPTPSLSVVAVYNQNEEQVELPYNDEGGSIIIEFNKPVNCEDLLGLKIEAMYPYESCSGYGYQILTPSIEAGAIYWYSHNDSIGICNLGLHTDFFDGTTNTIELRHGDDYFEYNRFYFE